MDWQQELIERIAAKPCTGYGSADSPATEPSALAALALAGFNRWGSVQRVAAWLAELQAADGSIGVRATEPQPCWPTSLAMLTWLSYRQNRNHLSREYQTQIEQATQWILAHRGLMLPHTPDTGHDSMIDAWSWVDDTHAWVEPTALHVIALKAAGYGEHVRTRSAIAMLLDRQLPTGGWNYGNTIILGNQLRAHVQPTSLALVALAGEPAAIAQTKPSLTYLQETVDGSTPVLSLCWALIALASQQIFPPMSERWLESAFHRIERTDASIHKFALIALALQKANCALIELPAKGQHSSTTPPAVTPA